MIGPAIAGTVGQATSWRYVFLGLLPLIALAGSLTLGALRAVRAGDVHPDAATAAAAAAARRGRLPLAITVPFGAGLLTVGLTTGEPIPTLVLSAARPADRGRPRCDASPRPGRSRHDRSCRRPSCCAGS